jgi:hypothetical protein
MIYTEHKALIMMDIGEYVESISDDFQDIIGAQRICPNFWMELLCYSL